ncbi:MAG: hypothetical protein GY711_33245 [bacterium]|nr:hypothetical protein [bacterium]
MLRTRVSLRLYLICALAGLAQVSSNAQVLDCTTPTTGPDVVLGDLTGIERIASLGSVGAYAIGTTKCNYGDGNLASLTNTSEHPVLLQHLYRLHEGRFEQIGMSWARHGYIVAATLGCCGTCTPSGSTSLLGPGCADANATATNGIQDLLGPRSDIDPWTGQFPFPFTGSGQSGDVLFRRLQVRDEDLLPALNPGARYFAEGHFLAPDDAAFGNGHNNASWREVLVGPGLQLLFSGPTMRGEPALFAWASIDPEVRLEQYDDLTGGRFWLASRAMSLGAGQWHYEYALYNHNSRLAARRFGVPLPAGTTVSAIGFSDADYHSGEIYSGDDWVVTVAPNELSWEADAAFVDPTANALRFGTVYNFRFDADVAPGANVVRVDDFVGGGFSFVGAQVPDLGMLGANFCTPPPPNSAGPGGFLTASGSDLVALNDLTLTMTGLPPNQFGYYLASLRPGFLLPPGSPGPLCVTSPIARFAQQVENAGAQGVIQVPIDLSAIPMTPPAAVVSGETWYFQGWYRDSPLSQFTEALAVHFR